jgi:hypothetical protein
MQIHGTAAENHSYPPKQRIAARGAAPPPTDDARLLTA